MLCEVVAVLREEVAVLREEVAVQREEVPVCKIMAKQVSLYGFLWCLSEEPVFN